MKLTIIVVTAGLGYILYRYRKNKNRWLQPKPFTKENVTIVETSEEMHTAVNTLLTDIEICNVLSLDCEWLQYRKNREAIALLQLASYTGHCYLFRLCKLHPSNELRDLLENPSVIKIGVNIKQDALYLCADYNMTVHNTVDIRHLATLVGDRPAGLAKMSQSILGITLNKDWSISASNWSSYSLDPMQVEYAALDAYTGMELFKYFASKMRYRFFYFGSRLQQVNKTMTYFLNKPYVEKIIQ